MSYSFAVDDRPGEEPLASVAALSPHSPFNTPAYAAALNSSAGRTWLMTLERDGETIAGCLAKLGGGRWNQTLEIFCVPSLESPDVFWKGVAERCRSAGIRELSAQTFASLEPSMPGLDGRLTSRDRFEFLLDLDDVGDISGYSKNHRRSIRKAEKAGLVVESSKDFDDYAVHVDLMRQSMVRRERRGEDVTLPSQRDFDFALLDSGAGLLFQARRDGETLASILILLSSNSGYYQSAGTSPEGMSIGASPFLIHAVASALAERGLGTLNLGGVDPGADGLRRFKSGFGSREIALRAETYAMTSMLRFRLTGAAIAAKRLLGR